MKTIGIDCRFAGGKSGLGRYTRSIVTELVKRGDPIRYILFVRSPREEWLQHLVLSDRCMLQVADIAHYSFAEQSRFPRMIAQSGIDMLFSPHFNVPIRCPVPFVVTIHDLILHRYPGASFLRQCAYRFQMQHSILNAKAICAVSSFTALEIGGAYGSAAFAKCNVTGEGVDAAFTPLSSASIQRVLEKYELHQPFFLYVGSDKPHKNVAKLIEAFCSHELSAKRLVLVVPPQQRATPLPEGIIHLSDVNDADLPALYSAAECFVTASLYEGYGLPVAEALSCGCPVIAGNHSAIPEAAGGAALLIGSSPTELSAALQSPPSRPVSYTRPLWSAAAARTAYVLQKALG